MPFNREDDGTLTYHKHRFETDEILRDLMCRSCAGWMDWDGERWRHADGSLGCVDPVTMRPYPEDDRGR